MTIMKPLIKWMSIDLYSLKAGIHYMIFARFSTNVQFRKADASCQRSETVCRFELTIDLTESIEND